MFGKETVDTASAPRDPNLSADAFREHPPSSYEAPRSAAMSGACATGASLRMR